MYEGYVFDLDGTIYLGDELLPGAKRLILKLRELGKRVIFLSNNPTKDPGMNAEKLGKLGLKTPASEIVNTVVTMTRWLLRDHPEPTVFPISEEPLKNSLSEAGIRMSEDPEEIDIVIASYDRGFDHRKLPSPIPPSPARSLCGGIRAWSSPVATPACWRRWRASSVPPYYHVWTSTDFVGVEVCAATKNCYALGTGFMEGESEARYRNYDYGAALFGQAARELGRFMELLGGERETPYGLAGVGDMFVTRMGGRNVKVGRLVGSGLRFSEARGLMPGVRLEGAAAIEVIGGALPRLTERGIIGPEDFPLMRHLHSVVGLDETLDMPWHTFFGGEPDSKPRKG